MEAPAERLKSRRAKRKERELSMVYNTSCRAARSLRGLEPNKSRRAKRGRRAASKSRKKESRSFIRKAEKRRKIELSTNKCIRREEDLAAKRA